MICMDRTLIHSAFSTEPAVYPKCDCSAAPQHPSPGRPPEFRYPHRQRFTVNGWRLAVRSRAVPGSNEDYATQITSELTPYRSRFSWRPRGSGLVRRIDYRRMTHAMLLRPPSARTVYSETDHRSPYVLSRLVRPIRGPVAAARYLAISKGKSETEIGLYEVFY
jgi:hypothetical protein